MYAVRPKTHGLAPHAWSGKCRTYHRRAVGKLATVPSNGYTGADMALAYQFPKAPASAEMPTVWIPELGGGFDPAEISSWCASRGFPMPNLTAVGVGGASNDYSGDPQSADVEVELDICNVIGAMAYMFPGRACNIVVVFAPNSSQGMPEAYNYILANAKPGDTAPISWGSPEDVESVNALEPILEQLAAKGITCTAASGDNGPDDGTGRPVTDYPGCSAWMVDCGATTITLRSDGSIANQVPWNSGGGASGGGYSKLISKPSWQTWSSNSGRAEPDCTANGDPATGWDTPFGTIGGTSAVAPFMGAFFAGINALLMAAGKPPLGLPNQLMYAHPECFTDIVVGSIGNGFPATVGPDTASGIGSIIGTKFSAVVLGTVPTQPPTNPPTQPPVTPSGLTLSQIQTIMDAETMRLIGLNPYLYRLLPQLDADYKSKIAAGWPK